jgi:hypothetical protein
LNLDAVGLLADITDRRGESVPAQRNDKKN